MSRYTLRSHSRRYKICSTAQVAFHVSFFFAGLSRRCLSRRLFFSQVGVVSVFHGESLPRRSESSLWFTASRVFTGRRRLLFSWQGSCSQVGVVFVVHGEILLGKSLFLACRNRVVCHGESRPRKSAFLSDQIRLPCSLRVSSCEKCLHRRTELCSFFASR